MGTVDAAVHSSEFCSGPGSIIMHRLKVTVEIELDVLDGVVLERDALAAIAAAEFTGGRPRGTRSAHG